jgi:hypothetical protein
MFSTNVPPVGEAAFDHFHCVEDDASSQEIYHLCKLKKPVDVTEMVAEPVPPDIHRFISELPYTLWLELPRSSSFFPSRKLPATFGGRGDGFSATA